MLISASGAVHPGFYLFTLGSSCHYVLREEDQNGKPALILFDAGLSAHITGLKKRFADNGLALNSITHLFITHLHPERIGGLPYLRRENQNLMVSMPAQMQRKLNDSDFARLIFESDQELSAMYGLASTLPRLSFEEYKALLLPTHVFPESDTIWISEDVFLRCLAAPGHTPESMAYLYSPAEYLIVDETFGYFRGKNLASPGGDHSLHESLTTLRRFKDLEINALCFPSTGMITGDLVRRHIEAVIRNTQDLLDESTKAFEDQVPEETIRTSILQSFYCSDSQDKLHKVLLDRSFEAGWRQLQTGATS